MLVAYLRGYLKPDYANGLRSVLRENFILEAIARDLDASEVVSRIQVESQYAPLLDSTKANKLLKHHDKMLSLAYTRFRHENTKHADTAGVDINSIDKFIELYKNLAQQGIVGEKQNGS